MRGSPREEPWWQLYQFGKVARALAISPLVEPTSRSKNGCTVWTVTSLVSPPHDSFPFYSLNAAIQHAVEVHALLSTIFVILHRRLGLHASSENGGTARSGQRLLIKALEVGRILRAGFLYLYIRCVAVCFYRGYALMSTLWMAATCEGNRMTTSSSPDSNTMHTGPILRHRYARCPEFRTVGIFDGILHNRTCI